MKVRPCAWGGTPRAPSPGEDAGPLRAEKGSRVAYKAQRRGDRDPGRGPHAPPELPAPPLLRAPPVPAPAACPVRTLLERQRTGSMRRPGDVSIFRSPSVGHLGGRGRGPDSSKFKA